MSQFKFVFRLFLVVMGFMTITATVRSEEKQPDIVFIIVDDLNDWVGCLGGHPDAKSPNIDALANSGMLFSQAYCNSPQCRPSRTSLNYGIYPFNTGTYFNARSPQETPIKTPSMQQFFMESGYRVVSGGKVFHGNPGKVGDALLGRPRDPKPPKGEDNFNALRAPNDGYALDVTDKEMGDYKVASWAIEQWNEVTEKPLFMSVGFYRPHRPLQVPKSWFEHFPLESIQRPAEPDRVDDWADMPVFAQRLARTHAHKPLHKGLSDHEYIVANDEWDATIRAYQASIAFVDHQIGRFVESLKHNPRGRETFVMLVSDHGWHLGEKKHWCKGAIWEQTTHIPFIVHGPGIKTGSTCTQPVSLIDVYPSLLDLAGIEIPDWLNGTSIKPQLAEPSSPRSAAISSYGEGNTSIRTERWRYIRYEDGSEELYDHRIDPNEWTNLANQREHKKLKKQLAAMIPTDQHSGIKVQSWFDKFQK
ncbi:MAG: iduronate-sulfatase and sulfatase 1 precursor [Blastopirellula sp.]|nr:MAG: iduronate-sulfatase and sulfatase 1 precursor [Blastopirellula sp.]